MNSITRVLAVAVFTTVVPVTLSAPTHAAGVGEVCFHTEPGYGGASWCYRPWGYADLPEYVHDKARSFESNSDVVVYAIDHAPGGRCYYRKIWAGDRDPNWTWGGRIDGVSTDSQGCEVS